MSHISKDILRQYREIRDIPYRIPLSMDERDDCCSGKAVRMKQVLEAGGFTARYRVCDFRWSELPIPKVVLAFPHDDDSTHVYLEVMVGNQWIDVDATWDSGLQGVLPVTNWDGETSTPVAVPVRTCRDDEESRAIMEKSDAENERGQLERNVDFFRALNQWLASIRRSADK